MTYFNLLLFQSQTLQVYTSTFLHHHHYIIIISSSYSIWRPLSDVLSANQFRLSVTGEQCTESSSTAAAAAAAASSYERSDRGGGGTELQCVIKDYLCDVPVPFVVVCACVCGCFLSELLNNNIISSGVSLNRVRWRAKMTVGFWTVAV